MNKVKKFRIHEERLDTRRNKETKKREQERRKARELKQTFREEKENE